VPVNVPGVDAFPVVIAVVKVFAIVVVPVKLALAIFAFAVIVKELPENAVALELFVAVMLFAVRFPVTVTAPNVVLPPLAVEVNDNQANPFASPSVGQT
jgi:hypothetical protein